MPESTIRLVEFQVEVLLFFYHQTTRTTTFDDVKKHFAKHDRLEALPETVWSLMDLGLIEEPTSKGKVKRLNYRITDDGKDEAESRERVAKQAAQRKRGGATRPSADEWDEQDGQDPPSEEPAEPARAGRKPSHRPRRTRKGAAADAQSAGASDQP